MIRLNAAFNRVRTAALRADYERERRDAGVGRSRWARDYDGTGGADPAPGRPIGSVLNFGRHLGWSIGEIARVDPGYLEWLENRRQGRPYLDGIDAVLRSVGFRPADAPKPTPSRSLRPG